MIVTAVIAGVAGWFLSLERVERKRFLQVVGRADVAPRLESDGVPPV
jgi:hypothetical protein